MPAQYFGEGITVLNQRIVQLTWQGQIGFIHNQSTFATESTFSYPGQGWALANDGKRIYMSDGTAQIGADPANGGQSERPHLYDRSRGLYTSEFFDASNPGGTTRLLPALMSITDTASSDAGDTLSEIAAATGGTAFHNSNDLLTGMQRVRRRAAVLHAGVCTGQRECGREVSLHLRKAPKRQVGGEGKTGLLGGCL